MSKKQYKKKRSRNGWGLTIMLFLLALIMLIPFYYILVNTVKTAEEATFHPMSLPTELHFERFVSAFQQMEYPLALLNTLLITIPTVLLSTLFSAAASYSLARCQNRLNKAVFALFLAGLMIPSTASLVPLYELMSSLRLTDTRTGLVLLSCGGMGMLSLFMLRSFLCSSTTIEIEEASEIDGCGILRKFYYVALPLMRPILATNLILNLTSSWNSYMYPSLFLQDPKKHTLLMKVNECVGQFTTDWSTMFCMLVLALLPLTIFFLLCQKQMIDGVSAGAVKG